METERRITDPVQRAKLVKLARLCNFLDDLPHPKFYLPKWCSPDATEVSCGTAGCVGGWAVTLHSTEWKFLRFGHEWIPTLRDTPLEYSLPIASAFKQFSDFFGLSRTHSHDVFGALSTGEWSYFYERSRAEVTPQLAAARIRRLIAEEYDPTILAEAEGPPVALPPVEPGVREAVTEAAP